MFKKATLVALVTLCAAAVYAAPWMSHNSRRAPKTLVVVGNYRTPRLMAATIKALTSQPYLIIAKDDKTNEDIYFITMTKVTVPVPADKLDVYINQLNPRRLVIIGDERFVTPAQEKKLRTINTKRIPIFRVYGGDWGRIAEELDDMLNIGNLAREFRRNFYNLSMSDPRLRDSADVNAETAAPSGAAAETPAEIPAAEPQEQSAN
jgi:hypothetical protein